MRERNPLDVLPMWRPSNFHQGKLMTNNTEASQRSSISRQAVLILRPDESIFLRKKHEARLAKSLHFGL